MSRGLGRLQRGLLGLIERHGKPMTFADIRTRIKQDVGNDQDMKFRTSVERSLRRALHQLTKEMFLIAMGDGGPGDPLRYFFHPLFIGMMGDTPRGRSLQEALENDAGANEAAAKYMAKVFGP
jgi:hypothetical protein